MSSKNLSVLGLPSKLATVPSVVDNRAETASQPLVVGPVLPEASPEVLKMCYRLLAGLSEVDSTILVAGMRTGASTSNLVVQIASALSQVQSQKVLLVDAELGGQMLPAILGIKSQPGLSELLGGRADLATSVQEITPKLFVLPAGSLALDASQFASMEFADLIARNLRREFRYVVIHCASFGDGVSANLLAPHSDGVVLAVSAGKHHRNELAELKKELNGVKTKVLGVVLVETTPPKLFQAPAPNPRRENRLILAALAAAGLSLGYAASSSLLAAAPTLANLIAPLTGRTDEVAGSSGAVPYRPAAVNPTSEVQEARTPAVNAIRHWTNNGVTIVAIDLQSQVQFEAHRLDNPNRIYFDLHDGALFSLLNAKTIEVKDGILEKIRVVQRRDGITRVVLDTQGAPDFSVSVEQEPPRLVIQMHNRTPKPAPPERATAPAHPIHRPKDIAHSNSSVRRVRA